MNDSDHTDRKTPAPDHPAGRLSDVAAYLAAIVESSDDAIVGKTLEGIVRSWNPAAERLFGYTAREALGRSVAELVIPPDRQQEEEEILARLARGERIDHFETVRVAKDGHELEVALTVSPIRDRTGRIVGASKIARDITARKRIEAAARRDRSTLEAVTDAAPVAVLVLDPEGVVQLWNKAAEVIFGWTAEEVIGRVSPAVPPEHLPELRDNLARTLAGEPLEGVEITRRRRDGTSVDVALWTSVLPDDGAPRRVISIGADITERKRAERLLSESEERFRTLADNIAQLAWMAEPDGSIFWYNKRWFDYTGTTPAEMDARGWQAVHDPDHVDRVTARYRRSMETGQVWEDTFPIRGADGRYRWFLSRAIPIRDSRGEVIRWFGTNTDITERMEMEEALREADRRKDEFLAVLSHELRNPLAPIESSLELLRREGSDPAVLARSLATLERQSGHLVRLIDDLLDISRITRGKVEVTTTRVELVSAVESAVEASQPLLDRAGHHLELVLPEERLALRGDPTRLAQIFSNLLNNAAKYTPTGGSVRLEAVREGDEAVVTVTDSGRGIEAERLERIFEMFVQAEHEDELRQPGLGIGLALAKALVELHGGSIRASSEGPGTGSRFVVRLPLDPAATAASAGARTATPAGTHRVAQPPLSVLVADDNRDAAESLALLLESFGHRVRAVHDGRRAVEAAAEELPDVAVLDLGMPRLDGYQTAEAVRELPGGAAVVLVALTGWGQEKDRERTRIAGFDHHLVKPTDFARLQAILDQVGDGDETPAAPDA